MSRIRGKDTKPELVVRRLLHRLGYRFRLHRKTLPGTPDLVFPSRRKAIFVHGCFWHAHGCKIGQAPKSRQEYWQPKLARNVERDAEKTDSLLRQGWQSLTVWQCQTRDAELLASLLLDFLGQPGKKPIDNPDAGR